MKIRVKMFAMLRERSGAGEIELELPDGATVDDAIKAVAKKYAGLAEALGRTAWAVNLAMVDRRKVLIDGDELALIPPVSGG
jgi:molybdopterin converting factor subunit 1